MFSHERIVFHKTSTQNTWNLNLEGEFVYVFDYSHPGIISGRTVEIKGNLIAFYPLNSKPDNI